MATLNKTGQVEELVDAMNERKLYILDLAKERKERHVHISRKSK